MNRREMIEAMVASVGVTGDPGVVADLPRRSIQGVGVLRYPEQFYADTEGKKTTGRDLAQALAQHIGVGTILCLPNGRDEHGDYCWDFRIEGGDPGQVKIERSEG